ncbi:MAG: hypothetical protein JWO05_1895 [Gemmatimonadetes bacterium]|nr:hypothetical protein [Gemmatimonadota bacterium]
MIPIMSEHRRGILRDAALLAALWLIPMLVGVGGHMFSMSMEADHMPYLHVWVHSASIWLFWIPVTPLVLHLARRFPVEGPHTAPNVALHVLAATLLFVVQVYVIYVAGKSVGHIGPNMTLARWYQVEVTEQYLFTIATYASIVGIEMALRLYRRQHERDVRTSQLEAQLAQARFHALQSQLEPHFLFNALNSAVTLVRSGTTADREAAVRLLVGFSDLLRTVLNDDSPTTTLARELEFAERYLDIERIRFPDRLRVTIDADPALMGVVVPRLFLQPLVENAIRHGIARDPKAGVVRISVGRQGNSIRVEVEDDGPGLPAGWNLAARAGVGLRNVLRRLELFDAGAGMSLDPSPRGGTLAAVWTPLSTAGSGSA